jgi:hypothetical protein
LGPWGPLSDVGPIFVANWYNNYAKYWINPLYNWTTYFSSINGPLTSAGPLGSNGPYTAENYYNNPALFNTNQFAANTRAFGLWSILGPIGPLGAVGPLGAIGPVGALGTIGLTTNSNGAYVNSGKQVVNEINVPYTTSQTRAFSPYANYTPNYVVKNAANNGTSFMVQDNFMYLSSANYTIHSNQDQIVTVLAVPTDEISTDVIYVSLYDTLGNLIASSNSTLFINYIEFTAPANTSYVVKLTASNLSLTPIYNLYITGSYNYLNQYYIQGDYIQHYKP